MEKNVESDSQSTMVEEYESNSQSAMTEEYESNPQSTMIGDCIQKWKQPTVMNAIVYLSRESTPLFICRRFLRAFGESIDDIESLIVKYHYYGTRDMMYSYLTEWYANKPNATIDDLIRVLKKAELHNLAERLEFMLDSTRSDSETEGYCIENPEDLLVLVTKCHKFASLPCKNSPGAAGFDLHADHDCMLPPKCWTEVSTGVRMRIPKNYYGKNSSRSGLAFKSNIFAFEGTIDSDFTGEIKVLMKNDGNSMFKINKNDRIAQIIIVRIHQRNWMRTVQPSEFPQTKRGSGGFGSTGK